MNNTLVGALAFTVGATIGSLVTWKLLKTKYERIANEEIKSVKEHFGKKSEYIPVEHEIFEPQKFEPEKIEVSNSEVKEYSSIIQGEKYMVEDPEMYTPTDRPFVISPEEFGELDDHEIVSFTYYSDKVLEDEFGEVIEHDYIDDIVGLDSLTRFGEYQDDSVFVRNIRLKRDYEILLDLRNHADIKRGG